MKVRLMQEAQDFKLHEVLPYQAPELVQDLGLERVFQAMAKGDIFLQDVARRALLRGHENTVATIRYRQEVLRDCLEHPDAVHGLYALALEAIERKKRYNIGFLDDYPGGILHRSVDAMRMFVELLRKVRSVAQAQSGQFRSRGFRSLFNRLADELSDSYFAEIEDHLQTLKFDHGLLLSAELGPGNESARHVLRRMNGQNRSWWRRLLRLGPPEFTFRLDDRDEAGAKALSELRNRGINLAANALAQSAEHVLGFFTSLRIELGFYVGCMNLREALQNLQAPVCFPDPEDGGSDRLQARGLYDLSLVLRMERPAVGNDLEANGRNPILVTGANQGGKSTFLRAVGQAQLMMQAGMFVSGGAFCSAISPAIFTHYKREEDAGLKRGKFDEELHRMSEIVNHLTPGSVLLLNESFAATDDREGSEVSDQVVSALLDRGIRILFVTHLFGFARTCFDRMGNAALFLRAERLEDGTRTYKLSPGAPLETSFGEDLFVQVFGDLSASALNTESPSGVEIRHER
jgi:hypothetical protein